MNSTNTPERVETQSSYILEMQSSFDSAFVDDSIINGRGSI